MEGPGLEGMKLEGILAVELLEPQYGVQPKLKNKIAYPGKAKITWGGRSSEIVPLSFLKSGAWRDVFAVAGLGLVIKIQQAIHAEHCNEKEAALAEGGLRGCAARVYGCVRCVWKGVAEQDVDVSCLVMEQVPWDFQSYVTEVWFGRKPEPWLSMRCRS